MSSSKTNNELAEDLARSLEATTSLMQSLLGEIRDNATSAAILKQKLESLGETVRELSCAIKDCDGKGSMATRFALIEKEIFDLKTKIISMSDDHQEDMDGIRADRVNDTKYTRELVLSKWKLLIVAIPGAISLIITIFKIIVGINNVSP